MTATVRTMRFDGLNITYPYKQAVIPLLDELSDEARDRRGQHRGIPPSLYFGEDD